MAVLVTCESGDPVAPPDSIITMSASPQTVVVPKSGCPPKPPDCRMRIDPNDVCRTRLTATVRSKNGSRLPDQELIFSTTGGELFPCSETQMLTDGNGQATSVLFTNQAATVTGRSGGNTGTTQVQTTTEAVSQVLLDVENTDLSGATLNQCVDTLDLVATVLGVTGAPVELATVLFDETASSTITGNFVPSGGQDVSDVNGEALVKWSPGSSQCASVCMADPNSAGICTLSFTASVGSVKSVEVPVADNIP